MGLSFYSIIVYVTKMKSRKWGLLIETSTKREYQPNDLRLAYGKLLLLVVKSLLLAHQTTWLDRNLLDTREMGIYFSSSFSCNSKERGEERGST